MRKLKRRNTQPKKLKRELLIAALKKHATIKLTCESEDIPYVGNCSAHDPATDREAEQWIRDQLDAGNEWAWCTAVVTASYKGFSATDALGACSYESEETFRIPGGYFDDMVITACAELADKLIEASALIDELLAKR